MKIILFSRPGINIVSGEIERLLNILAANGLDYAVNREFAAMINHSTPINIPQEKQYERPETHAGPDSIMVSYGGDGTFLETVKLVAGTKIPLLGVNFGRLGFLANVPKEEMDRAFRDLKEGRFATAERTMLQAEGDFDPTPEYPYAFNEFTVHRRGTSLVSAHVSVNGERLATYRGDGVIISTPSGSTAYSLSAGGPILSPECRCLVVSPIAPHNLTMRPLVIPDSSEVEIIVSSREPYSYASLDNVSFRVKNGARFRVKKSEKPVLLVSLQNISFFETLRNKMMWGVDGRNEGVGPQPTE